MNVYDFLSENMCGLIVIVFIVCWTVSNVAAARAAVRDRDQGGE